MVCLWEGLIAASDSWSVAGVCRGHAICFARQLWTDDRVLWVFGFRRHRSCQVAMCQGLAFIASEFRPLT